MANIKDCPGFETFGADVKEARKVKQLSRKTLAEQVNIDWRYLANIENDGTIPSLPVIIQLIKICGLPVERYFNPEIMREESAQRQRVSHKLKLCPEEFLPIIEGAIDGAIQIQQKNDRRMTKRRVHDNPLFCFWEDASCALSFFVRFSEKPGFCGYFLGVRTLFRGRRTKTASISCSPQNGVLNAGKWTKKKRRDKDSFLGLCPG